MVFGYEMPSLRSWRDWYFERGAVGGGAGGLGSEGFRGGKGLVSGLERGGAEMGERGLVMSASENGWMMLLKGEDLAAFTVTMASNSRIRPL